MSSNEICVFCSATWIRKEPSADQRQIRNLAQHTITPEIQPKK